MSDLTEFLAALISGDISALPEPDTNAEKYCAKALRVWDGELPTPKSEVDVYLYQLALLGVGGSECDCTIFNELLERRIEGEEYSVIVVPADPDYKAVTTWEDLQTEMATKYAGYDYSEVALTCASSGAVTGNGTSSMASTQPLNLWDKETFELWDYYKLEALYETDPDTLENNVIKTINALDAIKASIENRGVEVGEAPASDYAAKIDAIPMGGDVPVITDASYLFYEGVRVDDVDKYIPFIKNCTSMEKMFQNSTAVVVLDLSRLDTSMVTDMTYMFAGCSAASSIDVSNFDVSQVTHMSYMFSNCSALSALEVGDWNTQNVNFFKYMFRGCINLSDLDVSKWNTNGSSDMSYMFDNCQSLRELDLSGWDTSGVNKFTKMFDRCAALESILGFSAPYSSGLAIGFPLGTSGAPYALKRLTFRTDLPEGQYAIRSPINISHCSFERDGMVEMFNTLTDVSGLGLSSSYTTITITGNPCVTGTDADGNTVETLTADDILIATNKGWSVVTE